MSRPPAVRGQVSAVFAFLFVVATVWLGVCAAPLLGAPPPGASDDDDRPSRSERKKDDELIDEADPYAFLRARHRAWIEEVEVLITATEKAVFLELEADYQRDAFIDRFWKVRDPYPQTVRNEFRDRWREKAAAAREAFETLDGTRAQMMLLFGEPTHRTPITCEILRQSVDIWHYRQGSDLVNGYFTLVFLGTHTRGKFQRVWSPREGVSVLFAASFTGASPAQLGNAVQNRCLRGDELLEALATALDVDDLRRRGLLIPRINEEWVLTFRARSTEVPEDAERMSGRVDVSFPGRHQSRTVVQGLVTIPRSEATAASLGDYSGYNFLVDGEILRQGELFEQFRYRFDFAADRTGDEIPLVVQRYLRPGEYTLVLKVEDTEADRYFRHEGTIDVPRVEAKREAVAVAADGTVRALTDEEQAALAEAGAAVDGSTSLASTASTTQTSATASIFDEANASISTGDHAVLIHPPPEVLQVGRLRVDADVRGDGIAKVEFILNDRPVMRKRRPPYSVELNLGEAPRIHTVRAVALDEQNRFLAADEILINAGPHRFDVRLLEPQRGKTYTESVRVHAEVEVPEGERFDRVEVFLDETRVATLYQPPFEQPILLPEGLGLAYVRAVAYLKNGTTAEAVRFINAPDFVDEMDIDFVELYTSVLDKKGNFVEGLTAENFTVRENDVEQEIRRFESMKDLPIRAGLVLDTSLSMLEALPDVEKAAYRFFETVLQPRDRACIITFADEPNLVVRFTSDTTILAGGLASLEADGETALYDSIIFALHYFAGLKGKRAIIVLTDGEDSSSEYDFDDAIHFARRTGASVYVIALSLPTNARESRAKLARLTSETGGELFFIESARGLGRVYEAIQQELRSQYLLAYQSSHAASDEEFREVEIEVDRKGLEAKSMKGYFP